MPVYSYSPSKTVFVSEMKYTASQFTLIHCLEPDSIHQAITTPPSPPPPPCAIIYIILGSLNNKTVASPADILRRASRVPSAKLIRQIWQFFLELNSKGLSV